MANTHAHRTAARPSAGQPVGTEVREGVWAVDAGTPWYLDAPNRVWRVIDGRVDIFAISADQRVALGSVMPGESLGRYHVSPDGQWEAIAIGIPGT